MTKRLRSNERLSAGRSTQEAWPSVFSAAPAKIELSRGARNFVPHTYTVERRPQSFVQRRRHK